VAAFPVTRCSVIRAASSADPAIKRQATETLIAAYWKPVYKYIRVKWKQSNEDAKDLTQAFFFRATEKGFFDRFDPTKARLRTFVRLCVDRFVAKGRRSTASLKRGGDAEVLSLDFDGAEKELGLQLPTTGTEPDQFFRQEWVRGLFAFALDDLRRQCAASGKEAHFAVFQRYDLENHDADGKGLSYAQLGQQLGLSVSQVTNYLAFTRRTFRQLILDRLAAATGSDEEFQHELRQLFGDKKQ